MFRTKSDWIDLNLFCCEFASLFLPVMGLEGASRSRTLWVLGEHRFKESVPIEK